MNRAVKVLRQRLEELTDGLWSIGEQEKNLANLRESVQRAEANIAEAELEREQIIAALRSLDVEVQP